MAVFLADIRYPGKQGPLWSGGTEGSEDIGRLFHGEPELRDHLSLAD